MSLTASEGFRAYYAGGGAPLVKAVLTLAGGTVRDLTGADMALGGLSVTTATSSAGALRVGSAVTGTCELTLANHDLSWDGTDFEGATVVPYAGAVVGGDVEWLRLGTYGVHQPDSIGASVRLSCEDRMAALSLPYSDVQTAYPATLGTIVADVCAACGVPLATPSFANHGFVVAARPTAELSCIDVIGFAAQASGNFAYANPMGNLAFGWYPWDAQGDPIEVTALRSLEVGSQSWEVTGVSVTEDPVALADGSLPEDGATALSGSDGYVLSISGNPLVQAGSAATVAAQVAARVVGMPLRRVECDAMGDPTLVAGDWLAFTDRHGRTFEGPVTQATWRSTGSQRLACDVEAPDRGAAAPRSSVVSRAIEATKEAVRAARAAAGAASAIATEAQAVADAINQHFFADSQGAHVTQVDREAWDASPQGPNVLINSLGLLLRSALNNLVSVTSSATAFYDGLGNAASNVVAQFGAAGATIGKEASYHLVLAAQRIAMMLGTDTLVDLSTNGLTTALKFAGSTQASGTNYTDAEVEAIESYLNGSGITVSNKHVYDGGVDTGYTIGTASTTNKPVLDTAGNEITSASYDGISYYATAVGGRHFWVNESLYPQTEIPGAPVVMEAGGVNLTFANKALRMSPPLPIASGGTGTSAFGTVVQNDITADVSLTNSAWTSMGSVTLTEGTWLIRYAAKFTANATGRRQACLSTTAGSVSTAWTRYCGSQTPAASGTVTILNGTYIRTITASGDKTFYLNAYQNSGAALDATGNIQAIRIK